MAMEATVAGDSSIAGAAVKQAKTGQCDRKRAEVGVTVEYKDIYAGPILAGSRSKKMSNKLKVGAEAIMQAEKTGRRGAAVEEDSRGRSG
jgi:hypothetical protein